ncbi:hypothetical protein [Micromonospora sagamiensis]|uniref:Uncharacterized protein n=1 Tax=Micromonospora sagamiensis TaxID=47875 RepID=A0A562WEZ6_9ACTN|nr:hypothetical protein [Micromonospora sagamiensis]TWJ28786.1 hypothetical protein JD81_02292 [Micromonospora sagamiensis]
MNLDEPSLMSEGSAPPGADIRFRADPEAGLQVIPLAGTRIGAVRGSEEGWNRCAAAHLDTKPIAIGALINGGGYLCVRTAQRRVMVSFGVPAAAVIPITVIFWVNVGRGR